MYLWVNYKEYFHLARNVCKFLFLNLCDIMRQDGQASQFYLYSAKPEQRLSQGTFHVEQV